VGQRNHVLDGSADPPREGALLRGHVLAHVTYLPQENVPGQRTQRTNAFAAVRGEKTAMRPLAKLLWTLVYISYAV